MKKQDRQRVRTAAELISATTAHLLEYLFPSNVKMLTLARFIRLADTWFDLMNSYTVTHWKDAKNAFGLKLDTQMKIIDDFKKAVLNLRVGNRSNMMDWQKGIVQSLNALPMLFEDLNQNETYGVCSIFWDKKFSKFNQFSPALFSSLQLIVYQKHFF